MKIDDLEQKVYPPVDKFGDILPQLKEMGWYQDNPGGEWLAKKRAISSEGRRRYVSTTATLGQHNGCLLSLKHAIKFKGAVGEENWRDSDDRYHHMMKHFDPEKVSQIMIYVEYDGVCFIGEGNHRIQVCHDQGLSWIPADIRYFSGAEQMGSGVLYPRNAINGVIRPGKGLL